MVEGTTITPDPVPQADDFVLEHAPPAASAAPVAPAATPTPGTPAPTKAPDLSKTVEDLQKRLDEQSSTLASIGRNFETLLNRQTAPPAPAPAAEKETPDPTPQELVDDISANGLQALRRRGFLTQKDVQKTITDLRAEMTGLVSGTVKDAVIGQTYPELMQENSQFRKDVAVEFDNLVALAGPNANRHGLLEAAAKHVASRTPKTPATPSREERIAAQGDHGTGGDDDMVSAEVGYNNSQLLNSPEAKRFGITPEKLQAEARRMKRGK